VGVGYAISIYIAACAAVSLVATAFMPDHTGKDSRLLRRVIKSHQLFPPLGRGLFR
jgi:hypothetical protein